MNKIEKDTELSVINNEYRTKLACDKKEYLKRQERVLAMFYKELFTWSFMNISMWIITGIMILFQIAFFMIPYQDITGDAEVGGKLFFIVAIICISAALSYLKPYTQYKDSEEIISIDDKLKYLPISGEVLRRFRVKNAIKFLSIVFLMDLVLQITLSMLIMHEIVLGNILYPLVIGFLVPLVAVAFHWHCWRIRL